MHTQTHAYIHKDMYVFVYVCMCIACLLCALSHQVWLFSSVLGHFGGCFYDAINDNGRKEILRLPKIGEHLDN